MADLISVDSKLQDEEYFRTGVGRAYYSAHISARDFLAPRVRLQCDRAGKPTHQGIIDALKSGNPSAIGDALDQLMDMRHLADYEMNSPITKSDLEEARTLAGFILSDLGSWTK